MFGKFYSTTTKVQHRFLYVSRKPCWGGIPAWLCMLMSVPVQFADRNSSVATTVSASKEIILAAGTVHSPQILQLSGIGPKGLLESHNIDTLVDLPGVGYNFHDQPSMFMSVNCMWSLSPLTS